jgi:hypothetical protein
MFSAAWRPAAKMAVDRNNEAWMTRLRQATTCQSHRFATLDRGTLISLNRNSDVTV